MVGSINIGEEEMKVESEKGSLKVFSPIVLSPETAGPLVLQCKRCRRILGDSFAVKSSDPVANTISLRSVSNTRMVDDDPVMSGDKCVDGAAPPSQEDIKIQCVGCNSVVGTVGMGGANQNSRSSFSRLFTMDMRTISRYRLGVPERKQTSFSFGGSGSPSPPMYGSLYESTLLEPSENVWPEIEKIEKVILALNDRLQHLEKLNGVDVKYQL